MRRRQLWKSRMAAVGTVGALLAAAGCGSDDVSAEEAHRIVVNGLIDTGRPADVAECVAQRALERHEPGQLVNTEGRTSDDVNASVASIVADCTAQLAPSSTTTTTAPPSSTTSPPTTAVASTVPERLTAAYCEASRDVLVAVAAAERMDDPGPAPVEAWFREALDRSELAILIAPSGRLQDIHVVLNAELDDLEELAADAGYLIDTEDDRLNEEADAIGERIEAQRALLSDVVESGCDAELSDPATIEQLAAELADELLAVQPPATTAPGTTAPGRDEVPITNDVSGMELSVPSAWTQEQANPGQLGVPRSLIRASDLATFTSPGLNGEGVRIDALDGSVDYAALLAASPVVAACTLDHEEAYDDGLYVGTLRYYRECGGSAAWVVTVGAADADNQVAVYVEIRVPRADDPAVEIVLSTFYV